MPLPEPIPEPIPEPEPPTNNGGSAQFDSNNDSPNSAAYEAPEKVAIVPKSVDIKDSVVDIEGDGEE